MLSVTCLKRYIFQDELVLPCIQCGDSDKKGNDFQSSGSSRILAVRRS